MMSNFSLPDGAPPQVAHALSLGLNAFAVVRFLHDAEWNPMLIDCDHHIEPVLVPFIDTETPEDRAFALFNAALDWDRRPVHHVLFLTDAYMSKHSLDESNEDIIEPGLDPKAREVLQVLYVSRGPGQAPKAQLNSFPYSTDDRGKREWVTAEFVEWTTTIELSPMVLALMAATVSDDEVTELTGYAP